MRIFTSRLSSAASVVLFGLSCGQTDAARLADGGSGVGGAGANAPGDATSNATGPASLPAPSGNGGATGSPSNAVPASPVPGNPSPSNAVPSNGMPSNTAPPTPSGPQPTSVPTPGSGGTSANPDGGSPSTPTGGTGAVNPNAGAPNTAGGSGNPAGGANTGGTGDPGVVDGCDVGVPSGRIMECLGRGIVAVPAGNTTFVGWRLLGTDPSTVAFNLYAQSGAGAARLVCSRSENEGTWCHDDEATADTAYTVRAVVGGVEGTPSASAQRLSQDHLKIPLEPASSGAYVHLAWVGDLDGDGEYDFVVDRISADAPVVDGYSRDGRFLWRLNTGPLGADQDNIEGGASTMSNGHWDGVTVYDFDSDGRAEIAVKTANGFVFGDGSVLQHDNDADQFVSIVDGVTGEERARATLPDDYLADGPLQCHFGAGSFDGVRPSVVTKCKNRVGNGGFNLVAASYDFDGSTLSRRFEFTRTMDAADYHQIRIIDVDGDGKDELADGGYVIDDDGTLLYSLGPSGVVHGDRFHITDMDPTRPGLEGWGIQQDNANGLETYYYDAATGEILRRYENSSGTGGDMGRGTVADLFPDRPGLEYWSFNGMFSAGSGELVVQEVDRNVPWPNFTMQWDGDTGSELLDNNQVGDWDLVARSRNTYSFRRSFDGLVQARGAIPFYGDVLGDWRDEALLESSDHSELRVYTTTYETEVRLYTPAHNPAYRNSLTVHGYKQSHLVDYYSGFGMERPPAPNIRLAPRP